ncbi:MAG TPA: MIP/aquaporin family protein [Planctomycetota bacterium]|nr:MIP/aquaporin family protein [Planctomycetota bacterium]
MPPAEAAPPERARPSVPAPISAARRALSEGLGTAFLVASVVGSGIMGERLAGGNLALALLANSLASGAALMALILAFGPVSGAHFNPLVTLAMAFKKQLHWKNVPAYLLAQAVGGLVGVGLTHVMFELPVVMTSRHSRTGGPQWVSEAIATFGLLSVILGCAKARPAASAYAVGGYITAAYWFTSSTSFANPVMTLSRAFTDTFSGIRPQDVPGFIASQAVGAFLAIALFAWLWPLPESPDPVPEER